MTNDPENNPDTEAPYDTKSLGENDAPSRSPGASTFGFDTMLGKLVVDMGLVTQKELTECNGLLQDSTGDATGHTLADILVNHQFATRRQLDPVSYTHLTLPTKA